jgi:hypothetical protein
MTITLFRNSVSQFRCGKADARGVFGGSHGRKRIGFRLWRQIEARYLHAAAISTRIPSADRIARRLI